VAGNISLSIHYEHDTPTSNEKEAIDFICYRQPTIEDVNPAAIFSDWDESLLVTDNQSIPLIDSIVLYC